VPEVSVMLKALALFKNTRF